MNLGKISTWLVHLAAISLRASHALRTGMKLRATGTRINGLWSGWDNSSAIFGLLQNGTGQERIKRWRMLGAISKLTDILIYTVQII